MTSNNKPDEADAAIGLRLRQRREALSLSRQQLSEKTGVSLSTIQKNEIGANRIPAGRMRIYARALRVDPLYFFHDFDSPSEPGRLLEFALSEEGIEVNAAFLQMQDPAKRVVVLDMLDIITDMHDRLGRRWITRR